MKTYQPKVSTIQQYSDNQGEHIVHEGKLILVKTNPLEKELSNVIPDYLFSKWIDIVGHYKPIIISETELPVKGDKVLVETEIGYEIGECLGDTRVTANSSDQYICKTSSGTGTYYFYACHKILALPEHFSDKHLQAIVDGKMKDGDFVMVKCIRTNDMFDEEPDYEILCNKSTQNHITLFLVQQSLEEAIENYLKRDYLYDIPPDIVSEAIKFGAEWAVKNIYNG